MSEEMYQYTYESIVDKNLKIEYNPMKIKHQKYLIELAENIKAGEEKSTTFIDLLKKICLTLINKKENELYYNDFEYLVFLIRARSYGENIPYSITNKKNINENFVFNIFNDIKIIGKKHLNEHRVLMENGDIVKMTPLMLNEYSRINSFNNNESTNLKILTTSIRAKLHDDNVTKFDAEIEKENYFDELSINDLKKLKEAYNEFPKISTNKMVKIGDIDMVTDFGDFQSNFFVI